ncbi:hypothetical protein [Pseudescherichia sp.]|uniref:hypothetical protein n=1 Tax=Pseudescherichia sp. TaxID=2055881 RepID=UPI0028A0BDBF|nr:hypothetical protein [Pseudescherichia sp.]
MTISEVIDKQEARDMFAVGRYQLIPGTLKNAVNTLNLNPKLNFDEDVQDRIFNDYLIKVKRSAFINYLEGNGSVEDAIYDWAKEFASAGVRKGKRISSTIKRDEYGNKIKDSNGKTIKIDRIAAFEGESYYADDGLNTAHLMPLQMIKALEESKNEN